MRVPCHRALPALAALVLGACPGPRPDPSGSGDAGPQDSSVVEDADRPADAARSESGEDAAAVVLDASSFEAGLRDATSALDTRPRSDLGFLDGQLDGGSTDDAAVGADAPGADRAGAEACATEIGRAHV